MQDEELFTKTVVFVNTRHTAEKLYKSLQNRTNNPVALLNSWFFELEGFSSVADFKQAAISRILIVVNDAEETIDLQHIPFLVHFELPVDQDTFVKRITNTEADTGDETLALTFATDLELAMIKKIEQTIGQKIPLAELPEELVIEKEKKKAEIIEKQLSVKKGAEPMTGEAFHQKKASNSKTYNFSSGKKAKMNKKKNH